MIPFPYDYLAAEQLPDWRRELTLPLDFRTVRQTSQRLTRALMLAVAELPNEQQVMAYRAALPAMLRWSLIAAETAMYLEAIGDKPLATKLPEYEFLSGRTALHSCGLETRNPLSAQYPRRPLARQLVFTARWTPWWQLPRSLLVPQIRAYNQNADLMIGASMSRSSIRYDNVEHLYRDAVRKSNLGRRLFWDREQIRKLFANAIGETDLGTEMRSRLRELMTARLQPILEETSKELDGLRRVRRLPHEVWTGTGGYWPSRLVGLEIIRRGGIVRRFHHGYNINVIPYIEGWTTVDLASTTHFVFPSSIAANRWRSEPVEELLCAPAPAFEVLQKTRSRKKTTAKRGQGIARRTRPRVLFAAEQIRGYRQWIPSWFPDAVTLDWTLRLGEALKALPIELVCRPHPEGLLPGKHHPLNNLAPVPAENFEQLLPSVDVIILDGSISRVFCLALMSDKPVVLIDPGYKHIYPGLQSDLDARCTILKLDYGERGLPEIDQQQLAQAVLETRPPEPDLVRKFQAVFGEEPIQSSGH